MARHLDRDIQWRKALDWLNSTGIQLFEILLINVIPTTNSSNLTCSMALLKNLRTKKILHGSDNRVMGFALLRGNILKIAKNFIHLMNFAQTHFLIWLNKLHGIG